jgi:hypothetical protein
MGLGSMNHEKDDGLLLMFDVPNVNQIEHERQRKLINWRYDVVREKLIETNQKLINNGKFYSNNQFWCLKQWKMLRISMLKSQFVFRA